ALRARSARSFAVLVSGVVEQKRRDPQDLERVDEGANEFRAVVGFVLVEIEIGEEPSLRVEDDHVETAADFDELLGVDHPEARHGGVDEIPTNRLTRLSVKAQLVQDESESRRVDLGAVLDVEYQNANSLVRQLYGGH